jgi:biopolymer transport protein ExbB/TolQ
MQQFSKLAGDSCYALLAANGLWGLYCVIAVWRRLSQLRFRNEEVQTQWVEEVERSLNAGDFQTATAMCEHDNRALAQLTLMSILNRGLGYAKLRQFVADRFQRDVLAELEYRISWIMTVIKSGPLLGLYGTVLGMMAAFARIGTGEKVKPDQIADEISIALIATAMGLTTAIPFTFLLASINIRMRKLQDLVGLGLTRLMETFKSIAP